MDKCTVCNSDLSKEKSITRVYIDKDSGPDMYSYGHYDSNGDYEPDTNTDLSGGRYDLADGSDSCVECGNVIG